MYTIISAVQTEVISLVEAKLAIKIDSTSFADNIGTSFAVAGGYHAITATATGSSVTTVSKKTILTLNPVGVSSGGSLDIKLQESLDNSTFTDVGTAFATVTTANATALQELEYTGIYPYIRPVYTIVSAQVSFEIIVTQSEPSSIEDSYIGDLITSAREYAEEFTGRAIGSQKRAKYLDSFPTEDAISLPGVPLLSVDSVGYIDANGTTATMSANESSGYIVDTASEPGRLFLSYGGSWPSYTEYPRNAVVIKYTCGYTASTVPKKLKDAILKMVGALYRYRQDAIPEQDLRAIDNLMRGIRIIDIGGGC